MSGFLSNLKIPDVNTCCGCVNDIKTAAAIIAVLGIVTSPLVSWAVVRHAYVIRVSCFVTTSSTRPDVVDINLSNVLTFGFGANAGLGPSCLIKNSTTILRAKEIEMEEENEDAKHSKFVKTVRFVGWIVLAADFVFLLLSINFLIKVFNANGQSAAQYFVIGGLTSVTLSFIYGMLYISACIYMGGSFPIFEFVFALVDLIIWTFWLHFFVVIFTYSKPRPPRLTATQRLRKYVMQNIPYGRSATKTTSKSSRFTSKTSKSTTKATKSTTTTKPTSSFDRYMHFVIYTSISFIFSVVLLFNSGDFLQTESPVKKICRNKNINESISKEIED